MLNDSHGTFGVRCDGGSIAYLTSNLISGGFGASTHEMLFGDSTVCVGGGAAGNFKNNYFWYPAAGGHSSSEQVAYVAVSSMGSFDGNGNIINDNTGCYDGAYSQPDYHLSSGAPCIDKGANPPKRKDLSSITVDVDNNAHSLGVKPDIGCSEKQ